MGVHDGARDSRSPFGAVFSQPRCLPFALMILRFAFAIKAPPKENPFMLFQRNGVSDVYGGAKRRSEQHWVPSRPGGRGLAHLRASRALRSRVSPCQGRLQGSVLRVGCSLEPWSRGQSLSARDHSAAVPFVWRERSGEGGEGYTWTGGYRGGGPRPPPSLVESGPQALRLPPHPEAPESLGGLRGAGGSPWPTQAPWSVQLRVLLTPPDQEVRKTVEGSWRSLCLY